jgi:transposase
MHFVPVKSATMQADSIELATRQLLVQQRTQLVNSLRGHAAEFGVIAAKGIQKVDALLERIARGSGGARIAQIEYRDAQLRETDQRLSQQHKSYPASQLLSAVPGLAQYPR